MTARYIGGPRDGQPLEQEIPSPVVGLRNGAYVIGARGNLYWRPDVRRRGFLRLRTSRNY